MGSWGNYKYMHEPRRPGGKGRKNTNKHYNKMRPTGSANKVRDNHEKEGNTKKKKKKKKKTKKKKKKKKKKKGFTSLIIY